MSREINDPTKGGKAVFPNLMLLAKAYPRCRKMWHHPTEHWGEIYGLRSWYGYDWWMLDKKRKGWVYLTRTWDKVPTFTIKKRAMSFGTNSPWMTVHTPA